ncbi:MAG: Ig-like domain-containing protein [Terriglobales bacterium]
MKKLQISSALVCLAVIALVMAGCGGGSGSGTGSKSAVLQSIQIAPGTPSIAAGAAQQFKATGLYSDNSSKDLTKSATWSSSNTAAATISNVGLAATKAQGSVTITASYSGVSGSTTLTVTAAALAALAVAPANASLPLGTTVQLSATGTFTDGTTLDMTASVQWTSGNPAAVAINANGTFGLARATGLGSSTITASSGSIFSSANVTASSAAAVSVAITPLTTSIAQNTTTQFTATGTFTDGSMQNITGSVQWASGNPGVASINLNGAPGLALGIGAGSSTITATVSSGSIFASASLTVTSATVNSIAVTPATPSIPLGTLQQFSATGTFSDGTTQDITGTVAWSSSKTSIASITVSGLATARNLGTTTITATSGSVNGSATATINAADLASLAIQPGDSMIAATTSQQFSAIGTFNDGSTRDLTAQSTWTSSDAGVAKVGSASGLAKGLAPGAANITATIGSATASVNLTVTGATLMSISVTPVGRTIAPGTKLSFAATGTFNDASTQNITRDVTWASDNPPVATVGSVSLVTAVTPGTANISATLDGVTASAQLMVSSATLVSISVTPPSAVLAPASTLGCAATGTFSDGSTQTITATVTWNSSASNVASVNSAGQVTGQSAGTATIAAQQGSVNGMTAVVVESSALVSLQITPTAASVAVQTQAQFRVIGTFGDGSTQDLTQSASWTSSPASVATVSDSGGSKGLATGLIAGNATITAFFAGQVGTGALSVTDATLTSLTITPGDPSIPLGSSQRFTATGNFSDGTTENLTNQAMWTSSDVTVATIGVNGLANSVATGTATITASANGVSGNTVLTVF